VKKFEQKSARKSEGGNWWEISTKIGGIIVGKIISKKRWENRWENWWKNR